MPTTIWRVLASGTTSSDGPFKQTVRESRLGQAILNRVRKAKSAAWLASRKVGPTPYMVKIETIRQYAHAHNTRVLIETGTYRGEMIAAQERHFDRLLSVELDPALFESAKRRFTDRPNISVFHGDSAVRLSEMIRSVNEPALFWLDAHYSGGITARGEVDSPITAELEIVLERPFRDVILIDDVGDFDGRSGYPTLETLISKLAEQRSELTVECRDGIIRITHS